MPAPLSNSEFLTQLSNLFASRQAKGSVFITQKRLTYQAPTAEGDAEMAEAEGSGAGHAEGEADEDEREWPCLIRATDGQSKSTTKIKISTIVQPQDYTTFSTAYGNLLKASMSSLRKKRKAKGAAKSKAKAKDAAGKATFVIRLPKVVGPRRGAGVWKRRRAERRRERELKKLWARRRRDAAAAGGSSVP